MRVKASLLLPGLLTGSTWTSAAEALSVVSYGLGRRATDPLNYRYFDNASAKMKGTRQQYLDIAWNTANQEVSSLIQAPPANIGSRVGFTSESSPMDLCGVERSWIPHF